MVFQRSSPPCRACPNRGPSCHSGCREYIEWAALRQAERARARAQSRAAIEVWENRANKVYAAKRHWKHYNHA